MERDPGAPPAGLTGRFRLPERPAPPLGPDQHLAACDALLRWLPRAPRERVRIEGEFRL